MASIHPVSIWSKRTAFRIFLRFDQIRRDRPKKLFLDLGTWKTGCRHYDVINSGFGFSNSSLVELKKKLKNLKIIPKWFPFVSIPGVASSNRFIWEILFLKSLWLVNKNLKKIEKLPKISVQKFCEPAWNEYNHRDMYFCLILSIDFLKKLFLVPVKISKFF